MRVSCSLMMILLCGLLPGMVSAEDGNTETGAEFEAVPSRPPEYARSCTELARVSLIP